MPILDRLRGTPDPATPGLTEVDTLSEALRQEQDHSLLLEERLLTLEQQLHEPGWSHVDGSGQGEFSRQALRQITALSRLNAIKNPLVKRAINARLFYVWGQGVQIAAADEDVNDVIQAFITDPGNQAALFGQQAREAKDRSLHTDGNLFLALFTHPRTGRVQVRDIPFDEIVDIIRDPEDRTNVWFYKRQWRQPTLNPVTGATTEEERVAYYPDLRHQPLGRGRQRSIGGHEVRWFEPVLHVSDGKLDGWKFGLSLVYPVLDWARAYKEFLEDWASIVKALSRYAYKAKTSAKKTPAMRRALSDAADATDSTGRHKAGGTFVSDDGSDLVPVPKSGATVDAESGRPLANMVAAGMDVPYCVDEATEILTQRGWLDYRSLRVGDQALTLNHDTGLSEWQPVAEVCVFPAQTREMVAMQGVQHSSLTTPNHRWPVERPHYRGGVHKAVSGYDRVWATSESFKYDDRVPIAARCGDLPTEAKYTDALVESVAWFWTEGHITRNRDGNPARPVTITQATKADANCARIREALTLTFGPPVDAMPRTGSGARDGVPRWRVFPDCGGRKQTFWLNAEAGELLQSHAPNRVVRPEFLLALTQAQLALFIDTSMVADNGGKHMLAQKDRAAAEAFQFACTLAGHGTSLRLIDRGDRTPMWNVRVRRKRTMRPGLPGTRATVTYRGEVWCPRTENMTWLARRDGSVYFTGNTILMGDPDIGNLATAKTLDRPTELAMAMRQQMWATYFRQLCDYVIDRSVQAPAGALRGTVTRDEYDRVVVELADEADRTVTVDWPSLLEHDVAELVKAIVAADGTEHVPDEVIARLLLTVLGVEDIDEVMDSMRGEDGEFVSPGAREQASAGQAAVDAFRQGRDPAELLR